MNIINFRIFGCVYYFPIFGFLRQRTWNLAFEAASRTMRQRTKSLAVIAGLASITGVVIYSTMIYPKLNPEKYSEWISSNYEAY